MRGRLSRRRYLASIGASAALAGCSWNGAGDGDGEGSGGGATVDMTDNLTFEPASVGVGVGETVRWVNVGTVVHTVTAYGDRIPADASYVASGGFDSEAAARDAYPGGGIDGGETFEHAFETPGTYEYFCIPHERAGMRGTVEVDGG